MSATQPDTAGTACVTAAPLGAGDWLSLAAAPTFAAMALLTVLLGGDASAVMCLPVHNASALTGMLPMYILMSAFHAAPWLRLMSRRAELWQRQSAVGLQQPRRQGD